MYQQPLCHQQDLILGTASAQSQACTLQHVRRHCACLQYHTTQMASKQAATIFAASPAYSWLDLTTYGEILAVILYACASTCQQCWVPNQIETTSNAVRLVMRRWQIRKYRAHPIWEGICAENVAAAAHGQMRGAAWPLLQYKLLQGRPFCHLQGGGQQVFVLCITPGVLKAGGHRQQYGAMRTTADVQRVQSQSCRPPKGQHAT